MGVIFNLQNSSLLTLSLPTEEIFQVNSQYRPVANRPVVDFRCQPPQSEKVTTNCLVLRIVSALPFTHQPDRKARKASDLSAADLRYQNT